MVAVAINNSKVDNISNDKVAEIIKSQPTCIDFSKFLIEEFDFSHSELESLMAQNTSFVRCNFSSSDLSGANFSRATVLDGEFNDAKLIKSEAYRCYLAGAIFDGANIQRPSSKIIYWKVQVGMTLKNKT